MKKLCTILAVLFWAGASYAQTLTTPWISTPPIGPGGSVMLGPSGGSTIPPWVLPGAVIDMDFITPQYFGCTPVTCLSLTRASNATDLLPASASGYAYNTYGNNVLTLSPSVGLLIFEARTNQLLNSTAPATQTTASLAPGAYTLWVNGSGSATMSAGTGTGCGTGASTNGTPVNFTITVAGTCTVTVTGSLNFFQLELGAFGTSGIVTAGATATRAADNIAASGLLLTSLHGAQGTALIASFGVLNVNSGFNAVFIGAASANNQMPGILNNTNNSIQVFDGSTAGSVALGSGNYTLAVKSAVGWSGTTVSFVANNGTVGAQNYTATHNQAWNIGNVQSGQFLDGRITRLTIFPSRVSDVPLKALTQ